MNLTDERLRELENHALTRNQRALLRCRFASEFIHTGQYELAQQALGGLWQGIGERPALKELPAVTQAEVLLQCGSLTGWLGSARQIPEAQEKAKDLLFEAIRLFRSHGQKARVSEAQYELGMCYWRLGAFDEARIILKEAESGAGNNVELKAKILIRRTLVEIWTGRYHDAWNILKEAQPFFERSNDAIKGRWHGQMGLVLRRLGSTEGRPDYFDGAIIEYTAAIYHYEQSGHERYCGTNLNNLAFLLYKLKRYQEAHEHLDRAAEIFKGHNDSGNLAQVNETRARVLIAEGRYKEAEHVINDVVKTFEQGGESALLADALTLQGIVLARLGAYEKSLGIIRHAMNLASDSGSPCNAASAALTLIEEHAERLSETELYYVYRRANDLLKDSQDAEEIARLRAASLVVTKKLLGPEISNKDFNLAKVVREYEARFIEQALELEQGSITRAAKRLGIHHESLNHLLRKWHRNLLPKRKPAAKRKRSISKAYLIAKRKPVRVLQVEDNQLVAGAVKETLEMEGWKVEIYADGLSALKQLQSNAYYDLLLVDNELPDMQGVKLISETRKLSHRKHFPIIMLSASYCRREALNAGADAFLNKPDDVLQVVPTIARLLNLKRDKTEVLQRR